MKKLLCGIIIISALFTLCGCSMGYLIDTVTGYIMQDQSLHAEQTLPTQKTEEPTQPSTIPTEEPTEAPTEAPTETPETKPATVEKSSKVPYLQKIKRADQPIYKGPGYDYKQNGTVKVVGTFTIVKEEYDEDGNLWGKLKSGVGWVDLTQIKSQNKNPPLLTVSQAEKTLLKSGKYHHWIADESEYMVQIALRCSQNLTNVCLYEISMGEDDDILTEICSISAWKKDTPIVADVAFPMDFSSYAICFNDKNGKEHWFCIYQSGRNGEIALSTYTPPNK